MRSLKCKNRQKRLHILNNHSFLFLRQELPDPPGFLPEKWPGFVNCSRMNPTASSRVANPRAVNTFPPVLGPVPEPEARRVPGGKEVCVVFVERAVPEAVPEMAQLAGSGAGGFTK